MFFLIISILVVIARDTTKAIIVRSANLDDYLITLSLVSTIRDLYCKPPWRHLVYEWPESSFSTSDSQWPSSSKLSMAWEYHPQT